MKFHTYQCLLCGDHIYSRDQHDMHWCTCGNIAIDGGPKWVDGPEDQGYFRTTFVTTHYIPAEIDIKTVNPNNYVEIFRTDWEFNENKYGIVHDPKWTKEMVEIAKLKLMLLTMK
jgi:hypothetical protein